MYRPKALLPIPLRHMENPLRSSSGKGNSRRQASKSTSRMAAFIRVTTAGSASSKSSMTATSTCAGSATSATVAKICAAALARRASYACVPGAFAAFRLICGRLIPLFRKARQHLRDVHRAITLTRSYCIAVNKFSAAQ